MISVLCFSQIQPKYPVPPDLVWSQPNERRPSMPFLEARRRLLGTTHIKSRVGSHVKHGQSVCDARSLAPGPRACASSVFGIISKAASNGQSVRGSGPVPTLTFKDNIPAAEWPRNLTVTNIQPYAIVDDIRELFVDFYMEGLLHP